MTTTTTATVTLKDGYSRAKNPPTRTFRPMTPEEAKTLRPRQEIYFTSITNKGPYWRRCRVNGAVKTWKTRPDVEVPVKYGMYECARAVSDRGEMTLPNGGRLLVPID